MIGIDVYVAMVLLFGSTIEHWIAERDNSSDQTKDGTDTD